jgi:primosomal protein N''
MAISIEAPGTPFSARYTELDNLLAAQVCDLIGELQRKGYARTDIDADAVGQLLFNNLNQMFTEFVKAEDMTLTDLHAITARQNAPIAEFLARR